MSGASGILPPPPGFVGGGLGGGLGSRDLGIKGKTSSFVNLAAMLGEGLAER